MEREKSLKENLFYSIIRQLGRFLFPIISFPYVSRILETDGFGKFSFSLSLVNYFIMLSSLGINTYAIREGARIKKDINKLNKLVSELIVICITSSTISFLLLGLFFLISDKLRGYSGWSVCLATIIILNGIGADWINHIFEDFQYLAIRHLFMQGIAIVIMFLFVRNKNDILPYCVVYVISNAGGNLLNFIHLRKYIRFQGVELKSVLCHMKPIFILFLGNIATQIYINADITLLRVFYNDRIVGIYSAVTKLYSMVKQVLGAVMMVMIPRVSFAMKRKEIYFEELSKAFFEVIVIIAAPISIGLAVFAEDIIYIIVGHEYMIGVTAFRILAITIFFASMAGFFVNVMLIPKRMDLEALRVTGIAAITNVILNFIFIPAFGIEGAAFTTFLAEFIVAIVLFIRCRAFIIINEGNSDKRKFILGNIGVFIICCICKNYAKIGFGLMMAILISILWCFTIYRKKIIDVEHLFDQIGSM